jgi:hypothetical protein
MFQKPSRAAAGVLLGAALVFAAGPPDLITAQTSEMQIAARLITDKSAQTKAIGSDLDRQYVIVELTVTPRGGYPVAISRDDFLLRSSRDNERATADSPDRIAGDAVLVLGSKGGSGRAIYSEDPGAVIVGGLPGTGSRPQRVGNRSNSGAAVGGGSEAAETTVAATRTPASPLLQALESKELRLGEIRQPVTGYLYFQVDPDQKTKNFVLHYKGAGGSCELRFK